MMKIMSKFMPDCNAISKKISESMDHKISPYDRIMIRIHVLFCKFCKQYKNQLIIVRSILRKYSENIKENDSNISPNLQQEAIARIKQNLKKNNIK